MISELHFWHLCWCSEDITHFKTRCSWSDNRQLPSTCYNEQPLPWFLWSLFRNFKTKFFTARYLWMVCNQSVQRAAVSNKLCLTGFVISSLLSPPSSRDPWKRRHRKHDSVCVCWFPKRCRSASTSAWHATAPRSRGRAALASPVHAHLCTWRESNLGRLDPTALALGWVGPNIAPTWQAHRGAPPPPPRSQWGKSSHVIHGQAQTPDVLTPQNWVAGWQQAVEMRKLAPRCFFLTPSARLSPLQSTGGMLFSCYFHLSAYSSGCVCLLPSPVGMVVRSGETDVCLVVLSAWG